MNEAGDLVEWNDAKGYGFVRTSSGERLFIHATAFQASVRRPEIGDRLAFRRGPGRDGRPAVIVANIAGATGHRAPDPARVERAQSSRALRIALAAFLLLGVIYAHNIGRAPDWLVLVYAVAGIASAAFYWVDKRAAQAGQWRIAETTLHMLDLCAGIIGGLLAQAGLRHKTAKPGFAAITIFIAIGHLAFIGLLIMGILDLPSL